MKRWLLVLAGCVFALQSYGRDKSHQNKISVGVGLGYRSEYNTSGYFIEYEPVKNVKLSVGAAISVYVPAGVSIGAKWFLKDVLIKKEQRSGGKTKFLSPYIGCSYMSISANKITYSNSGILSDYHFPATNYVITSAGVRISSMNYRSRSRTLGGSVYLYADYKARIKGGDIEYENGPQLPESQSVVNRLISSGPGFGVSFVLDLRLKQR